jgi:hypothetical protein
LTRNIGLRRLHWVGHVKRMKDERVPKKALEGYTEGKRQLEGPCSGQGCKEGVEMQKLENVGRG